MDYSSNWQRDGALGTRIGSCAGSIRAAAATLGNARSREITSTRVVGVIGREDLAALRRLVARVADEHGLYASTHVNVGTFSVHFMRAPR